MRRPFLLFLAIGCCFFPKAGAQELLTLDEAIARALKHNYDIRIADATAQQSAANNTLGNAGFLPTVAGTSNVNETNNNAHIQFADGTETNRPSANTLSYSTGLTASFTVFAAGRAFLVKKQLAELQKVGEVQLKAQMQTTVSEVVQAYALVVNDQQQLVATDTAMDLAKARMDLSKAKYDIGTSAKVDYLQGMVDYNAARAQLLTQDAELATARANLNYLMGEDAGMAYTVEDSLPLNLSLEAAEPKELADHNLNLEVARRNADVYRLDARIARTYYFPSVSINGGYAYTHTKSDAGTYLVNQGFGPTGGVGLNVPIFQAGNVRRQVRVANLQSEIGQLTYNRLNVQVESQYAGALKTYQNAVADYSLEQESIKAAKENLTIQQARFRVGVATSLEIREAENSYVSALARLYTAAYNVKVNETRVLELQSGLVQ